MDQGLAQFLVLAFAGASALSLFEMKASLQAPVCAECPHCQRLELEKRRREEELRDAYARRYGLVDPEDDDRRSRPPH